MSLIMSRASCIYLHHLLVLYMSYKPMSATKYISVSVLGDCTVYSV